MTATTGGAALTGISVEASHATTGAYVNQATTDASGNYTMTRLAIASYKVLFNAPSNSQYLDEYYDGQRSASSANPVVVTLNNTTSSIDAALETGGRITGRVIDPVSDNGIAGVGVSANGLNNGGSGYATIVFQKKCISQGHGEIEILAPSDKIGGYGQETNVFSSNNRATETTAV